MAKTILGQKKTNKTKIVKKKEKTYILNVTLSECDITVWSHIISVPQYETQKFIVLL